MVLPSSCLKGISLHHTYEQYGFNDFVNHQVPLNMIDRGFVNYKQAVLPRDTTVINPILIKFHTISGNVHGKWQKKILIVKGRKVLGS